ncbi:ferredoxin [Streptomyces sp. NPDC087440]|uniref:ferredoxin n=1 Tax=Streptomyces sp. NPDC087440 TaxID=3365790 RepID=UPI0038205798
MQIQADTQRCIGAGMCALISPDHFDQSDLDGTVVVLPTGEGERKPVSDAARRAVRHCPSGALTLTD